MDIWNLIKVKKIHIALVEDATNLGLAWKPFVER